MPTTGEPAGWNVFPADSDARLRYARRVLRFGWYSSPCTLLNPLYNDAQATHSHQMLSFAVETRVLTGFEPGKHPRLHRFKSWFFSSARRNIARFSNEKTAREGRLCSFVS